MNNLSHQDAVTTNKDWLKTQTKQQQIDIYARVYDMMTYRKAYFGENLTVEEALKKIRENMENKSHG